MPSIAVLTSGGLDSAILVADLANRREAVHPIYIRSGLYWEEAELAHLQRFLEAVQLQRPALKMLNILELPVGDIYGRHWSLTGDNVPDAQSEDSAVYLPGRNLLLLTKGMLWCHMHQIPAVAIGVLASNPFPDSGTPFFDSLASVVNRALRDQIVIERPYGGMSKREVMLRGQGLPLQYTLSCIRPVGGRHCGRCNKCAERIKAFADASMQDLTEYATRQS